MKIIYIRKKRLAKWIVSCFVITYMYFILIHATQYIQYDTQYEENGINPEDLPIPDIPGIPDVPIIREKVSGNF